MPNMDGTGPRGEGPKTGRQMGNCKDAKKDVTPIRKNANRGRGFRRSIN